MEVSQYCENKPLNRLGWPFYVWWLVLFTLSYLIHSARALVTATSVRDWRQTECVGYGRNDLGYTTILPTKWSFDNVTVRLAVVSVVATTLHLVIIGVLGYVLCGQFQDSSCIYTTLLISAAKGEDEEKIDTSTEDRQGLGVDSHQECPESTQYESENTSLDDAISEKSDPGYASQDQASEKGQDDPQVMVSHLNDDTHIRAPSQEIEYRTILAESDFALLENYLKEDINCGAFVARRSLDRFFAFEYRLDTFTLLCGYAIFKRNHSILEHILERAEERNIMPGGKLPSEHTVGRYIHFAIECQYQDILDTLCHYCPWTMDIYIGCFGQAAILSGSLSQFEIVWQYLCCDRGFLQECLAQASWNNQNEVLHFIIRECIEAGTGELEDALRDSICQLNHDMVRFWLGERVDPRTPTLELIRLELKLPNEKPPPSALFLAAEQGDVQIMTMLLDKDAEIHPDEGMMPGLLETALSKQKHDVAELLLSRGADVLEVSLDSAVAAGWTDTVKILLQSGRRDFGSPLYGTVLQRACTLGNFETVQLLLEYGHEINPKSPSGIGGSSPLMGARTGEHAYLVHFLIANGACVADSESVFEDRSFSSGLH